MRCVAQGGGEPRIWFMTLYCGDTYPKTPPTIRFTSRIVMDCVDPTGKVRPAVGRATRGGRP